MALHSGEASVRGRRLSTKDAGSSTALAGRTISFDLSAWHAGVFLTSVAVLLGVAVYGFRIALAGQPLLDIKDEI